MTDVTKIRDMILEQMMAQAQTTSHGRAILAAGLGDEMARLLRACANNVAQVVADPESMADALSA